MSNFVALWEALRQRRELLGFVRGPGPLARVLAPEASERQRQVLARLAPEVQEQLSRLNGILGLEASEPLPPPLAAVSGAQRALEYYHAELSSRLVWLVPTLALVFLYGWLTDRPFPVGPVGRFAYYIAVGGVAGYFGAGLGGAGAGYLSAFLPGSRLARMFLGTVVFFGYFAVLGGVLAILAPLPFTLVIAAAAAMSLLIGPVATLVLESIEGAG